jgi:hypothetical protein
LGPAGRSGHVQPLTYSSAARLCVRAALVVAAATASLVLVPSAPGASYGWPLKPFFQQHPVRGFFGDPRIGHGRRGESHSFHFGVDVSAPDGTLVYATVSGQVVVSRAHPETVAIRARDGSTVFAYWHIVPTVRHGDRAFAYRTVLGRIAKGWGHVHFAETRNGRYLNPLRPGAMAPFADTTRPVIQAFSFERDGTAIGRRALHGRFDLVVEASDTTPVAVPAPWNDRPVTPVALRWRVVALHGRATRWETAVDFRATIPPPSAFHAVYARWTRQNHPWSDGRYRFLLARSWDSRTLPAGRYRLEAVAVDSRGNAARRSAIFSIANEV